MRKKAVALDFTCSDDRDLEIVWSNPAIKGLRRCPAHHRDAILRRLEAVAADPRASHGFAIAMVGTKGWFRVRAGEWRAVYVLDFRARTLTVIRAGHRRDAYRNP